MAAAARAAGVAGSPGRHRARGRRGSRSPRKAPVVCLESIRTPKFRFEFRVPYHTPPHLPLPASPRREFPRLLRLLQRRRCGPAGSPRVTVRAEIVAARPELGGLLVPAGAEASRGPPSDSGEGPGEGPGPADTAARRERIPLVAAGGAGCDEPGRESDSAPPREPGRLPARLEPGRLGARRPACRPGAGRRVLAARVRSAEAVRTTKRDESVSF